VKDHPETETGGIKKGLSYLPWQEGGGSFVVASEISPQLGPEARLNSVGVAPAEGIHRGQPPDTTVFPGGN